MLEVDLPDLTCSHFCEECIAANLIELHEEKEAYRKMLDAAVFTALEKDERLTATETHLETVTDEAMKAIVQNHVTKTTAKDMLVNVHDALGELLKLAQAAKSTADPSTTNEREIQ
jgi:hypothetical protein